MHKEIRPFEPLPLKERIRSFRKSRGWNQTQLAEATGVTQSQVSRWEAGDDVPTSTALAAIASLADDTERTLWIADAGLSQFMGNRDEDVRKIPVLKDAAAAGTPRAIDPHATESTISLPRSWLPKGGKLYALWVSGDSMAPIVNDGYLVIVSVSGRKPDELLGRMVAARQGEGITIKWLRKDAGVYFLVPQQTSEGHPIRVLTQEGDWSIVGEVVKIIGDPPTPPRQKDRT